MTKKTDREPPAAISSTKVRVAHKSGQRAEKFICGFFLCQEGDVMLRAFMKEMKCTLAEACRLAIFHLLGDWEFGKLKKKEEKDAGKNQTAD